MRISDWSSDVCSSDLLPTRRKTTSKAKMAVDKYSKPPATHPLPIGAKSVFRISCPALMIALFAGGLSIQVARAQTPVPGLVPHVDLNASLDAGPGQHKASDIAAGQIGRAHV